MVDTTGKTNYTIALKDTANAPYVFHNLVIGKTADGHFKRPYVMTYTMSEAFREEYDRTKSIANFEGQVTIQYLSSSVLNHKEGSANLSNQSSVSNTNDPCPDQTITVNAGGGGGGNNSDGNPPNVDDYTGQMCIYYWIDYEDSSGEHTGSNEFSISATQAILYIDCFNIGSTASGTQPCDEQAEFAVIDPFNIIKLTPEAYGDDES